MTPLHTVNAREKKVQMPPLVFSMKTHQRVQSEVTLNPFNIREKRMRREKNSFGFLFEMCFMFRMRRPKETE